MLSDIRYAWRTLIKSPGFLFTATAALALGIGANAAIFSIVNATLLNPAGIANPERIVAVRVRYDKLNLRSIRVSPPDFADVRDSTQVFEHAAVMEEGDFNYTGNTVPERLQGAGVSVQWFDVFGAKPRLGRVFRNEEDQPNASHEVVFSYQAWQRLFGADPKVLGTKIELNTQPYEIVGVMGPEFRWPAQVDLWVPMGLPASVFGEGDRFNEELFAVARLRPNLSVNDGNAVIRILADRVRNSGNAGGAYAKDSAWGMFAVPITDFIAGDTKKPMLVLLGAVGFVLLIACANIAGLMLARASSRAREIAVRAALGASRWNLIRQALLESVLLVLPGSIAALGIAYLGIRLLLLLAPEQLATGLTVRLDAHVLLFTAAVAVAAAILSGIAPAWQVSRIERYESLKEGGRSGTASRARQRLRSALVTAEVALALVLLAGAGLFLRSLIRLQDIGTGFQPRGVMTATLSLPRAQYGQPEKRAAFFHTVMERLQGGAGVVSAGLGTPLPFSGGESSASFGIEGRDLGPGDPGPHGDVRYVTAGYFQTLGIPVLRGRALEDQDRAGSLPVVVIDENLAKQYWPNQNPVGQHLRRGQRGPWSTIVGVVGHVKHSDLAGDTGKGVYYYSLFQQTIPFVSVVVKTAGDPAGMAGIIREAVRSADPSQPVHTLKTLQDMVAASLAPRRFAVSLLGFFAGTALLMAAIGLYGVIGYSVGQRTQEMGIRMALGAARSEVLGLVIAQGLRMTAAGLAIGIAAALALTRLVSSQLFGITPFDPLTFAVAALVLFVAALAASYFPARRATRVDPMSALRYE